MSESLETRRLLAATLLADINVTPAGSPTRLSSSTSRPTTAPVVVNGRAVFPALVGAVVGPVNSESTDLWSTDGTPAGTTRLADLDRIGAIVRVGDSALVLANASPSSNFGSSLWRTGGTAATTAKVTDVFYEVSNGPTVDSVAQLNGVIYFSGDTTVLNTRRGWELFRSDGTAAGTYRVKDIETRGSIAASSFVRNLTTVGNRVFFTALTATNGNTLWVTDGTEAGTVILKSFHPLTSQSTTASNLVDFNGTLLFRARGPNNEDELWKSDGTTEGTVLVRQFEPNGGFSSLELAPAGNFVYFAASELGTPFNTELWKTDGTAAGTVRVKDIHAGTNFPSSPHRLIPVGDRVFFIAADAAGGSEVWVSDGTEAGTTRVADLRPGVDSSRSILWTAVGGRVYFTADDGATGHELYSTDGTPAGTTLVDDVFPGPTGSNPRWPTAVGEKIVFWADDGVHGAEPMAAPLTDAPPAAVVGRHLFYNDSAFDGGDPAPDPADDGAIAPDKAPLLPGRPVSFANLTSYSRGINGMMIDVSGNRPLTALAGIAAGLELKAGSSGDPSQWPDAPRPSQVTIRRGAGVNGSDRITLVWPDGAIRNTWLRVTVRALPPSGLPADDVFAFGNLLGETGDPGDAPPAAISVGPAVTAVDARETRLNRTPTAGITNRFDHNRDGGVNVLDYSSALRNVGRSLRWNPPPQVAAQATPSNRLRGAPIRRTVLEAAPADRA